MTDAQAVEVAIFDVSGREVRVLADEVVAAGQHTFEWDGLGRAGQPLAPGVYWAHARVGDREVRERLILSR